MWLDFLEEYQYAATREHIHCVYTEILPGLLWSLATQYGPSSPAIIEALARTASPPEDLRLPYGLVHALILIETIHLPEARELLTETAMPAAGQWGIYRDLLAMYCDFRNKRKENAVQLLTQYMESDDDDDWIIHNTVSCIGNDASTGYDPSWNTARRHDGVCRSNRRRNRNLGERQTRCR